MSFLTTAIPPFENYAIISYIIEKATLSGGFLIDFSAQRDKCIAGGKNECNDNSEGLNLPGLSCENEAAGDKTDSDAVFYDFYNCIILSSQRARRKRTVVMKGKRKSKGVIFIT